MLAPEQQEELRTKAAASAECLAAIEAKDIDKLTAILSVGRTRLTSRFITAPGVRDLLGPVQGARFIRVLKELSEGIPAWLPPILTAIGIPEDEHADYADTLGSGYEGIYDKPGIDLGTVTAQAMLILLKQAPGISVESIDLLLAQGVSADPLDRLDVEATFFTTL